QESSGDGYGRRRLNSIIRFDQHTHAFSISDEYQRVDHKVMKNRKVRNRLLELIQERERQIGRRIKQRDIAQFVGVSDRTIISWIRNEVTRFDGNVIEGLCAYFNCDISDLLYFEWVDGETAADTDSVS